MLWPVAAIDIYTPQALDALNGTDVRLKCTFRSQVPPGKQVTVTWNFRPHVGGQDQNVSQSGSPGMWGRVTFRASPVPAPDQPFWGGADPQAVQGV